MTVREYFNNYVMLTNLPSTIDYDTFKNRFIAIYGLREIRGDVPIDDISMIAQSAYNSNAQLITPLFQNNINPFKTWTENGSGSDNETGENDGNSSSNFSGNGTNDTTENITTNTANNNTTQTNNVYAFNAQTTATPTDTSSGSSTTTSNNTNTSKNATSEKSEQTNSDHATHTINRDNNYNKSGFNISDYERTFAVFIAPYDYLIRLIASEICVTAFELFGGYC